MNSVSLSSHEEAVIKSFGVPENVHEISSPKTKYLVYKDMKSVWKLMRFSVISSQGTIVPPKESLKGDSRVKVMKTYGPNYYERTDTSSDIIGYLDKQQGINIEFSFHRNNLVGIILMKNN
jgi:hypothetical protein